MAQEAEWTQSRINLDQSRQIHTKIHSKLVKTDDKGKNIFTT